jgi:serine/threonine protein kinase
MKKSLLKKFTMLGLFSCASKPSSEKGPSRKSKTVEQRKLLGGTFSDKYVVEQVIGCGGFGTVYAGYRKTDKKPVAIKIAKKDKVKGWVKVNGELIPREVWCLQRVTHVSGVVHLLDYYDYRSRSMYVVVMERPEHGQDLFDYITDRETLDESEARQFMHQVVRTLLEVHDAGILHRDVKDENIIVDLDTKCVRLVDFGSATQLRLDSEYTEFDGTILYSSPEWLLRHRYSAVSYTVWTLGILLYDMVCGNLPFHTGNSIVLATPSLPDRLSPELKSLIRRCLAVDPTQRPTLDQILEDPWMSHQDCDVDTGKCSRDTAGGEDMDVQGEQLPGGDERLTVTSSTTVDISSVAAADSDDVDSQCSVKPPTPATSCTAEAIDGLLLLPHDTVLVTDVPVIGG